MCFSHTAVLTQHLLSWQMAARKSVCCGLSAREATLAVLLVIMTAVSVTLITLMATGKTQSGESHGHMAADRKYQNLFPDLQV